MALLWGGIIADTHIIHLKVLLEDGFTSGRKHFFF